MNKPKPNPKAPALGLSASSQSSGGTLIAHRGDVKQLPWSQGWKPVNREIIDSGEYLYLHAHDMDMASSKDLLSACRKLWTLPALAHASFGWIPDGIKPKAVFMDFDGTLVEEESLVVLSRAANVMPQVEAITEAAMAGRINFREAVDQRLALLKGMTRDQVEQAARSLTIHQGLKELAAGLSHMGLEFHIVTGGFIEMVTLALEGVPIRAICSNKFRWNGNKLAGAIEEPLIDGAGKLKYIEAICSQRGWDVQSASIAVGDGANDLPMMGGSGLAVGFLAKAILHPHVHLYNGRGDHRLLLAALATLVSSRT